MLILRKIFGEGHQNIVIDFNAFKNYLLFVVNNKYNNEKKNVRKINFEKT